jgi:phosphoenolpyruvate carboxylase
LLKNSLVSKSVLWPTSINVIAAAQSFRCIDPPHHLQAELVHRWRAGQGDERVQTGMHVSINEIVAGLRDTG